MPWVLLAIALIVGSVLVARWWVNAEPATIWRVLRWFCVAVGAALLLAIAVSGRWSWLWTLAVFAIPWLTRLRALNTLRRNAAGPRPGQASEVETRFLRMALDHDTGEMDGEVREGAYTGSRLSTLSLGALIELWRVCAAEDEQSRAVLESFLDRAHPEWRAVAGIGPGTDGAGADDTGAGGPQGGRRESPWNRGTMSSEEARQVLGVGPGAGEEEIERAYRQAMKSAHPDHGGSDWMAAKVNQAREVLLRG